MLRVDAFLLTYPPQRFIGAELATHALLRTLSNRGHQVTVHVVDGVDRPYGFDGLSVVPFRGLPDSADVLVTHPYISPHLMEPVDRHPAPTVMMAHSTWAHIRKAVSERPLDLLVSNSLATHRLLSAEVSSTVRHVVVRPPLRYKPDRAFLAEQLLSPKSHRVAGYVNGIRAKGGEIIDDVIAHAYPRWDFVGVRGGWTDQNSKDLVLSNVDRFSYDRQFHPSEMIDRYYSRISVHLQPSLTESWGMSALEALANGVPVVASDLPGIREALRPFGPDWVRYVDVDGPPWVTSGNVIDLMDDLVEVRPCGRSAVDEIEAIVSDIRVMSANDRSTCALTIEDVVNSS